MNTLAANHPCLPLQGCGGADQHKRVRPALCPRSSTVYATVHNVSIKNTRNLRCVSSGASMSADASGGNGGNGGPRALPPTGGAPLLRIDEKRLLHQAPANAYSEDEPLPASAAPEYEAHLCQLDAYLLQKRTGGRADSDLYSLSCSWHCSVARVWPRHMPSSRRRRSSLRPLTSSQADW